MTNDRQRALEFFREIASVNALPCDGGGVSVVGIQFRNRPTINDDLQKLNAFADSLTVVGLEGTRVSDDGLLHLCSLPQLDNVDLTNTSITDAGLCILASIPTLQWIHLDGTHVTRRGVDALQAALPQCEIASDFA